MQYSKPMIDLVLQIRKIVPTDIKPQIKLGNPELLDYLLEVYPLLENPPLRARLTRLFELAGPEWVTAAAALLTPAPEALPAARLYRGQTVLDDAQTGDGAASKPKTITYRGRVVTLGS